MRIAVNLATRPFADIGPMIKRLRIGMGVLAVVGIGLGVGLHLLHHKAELARAREHSLDGAITRVTGERQGYEAMMRQPDNAEVLTQSENLNKLFDEKAFSWTLAMEDLETVLPGGVQVTTLEPVRDKQGNITLRLRIVGPRDKDLETVQNLEHSRHFLLPRIVGESAENSGGPGEKLEPVSASNRVTFEVLADYNPATLADKPVVKKSAEGAEKKGKPEGTGAAHGTGRPGSSRPGSIRPGSAGPGLRRVPMSGVARPGAPVKARKPPAGEPK